MEESTKQYSVNQLRIDLWNKLKEKAILLANPDTKKKTSLIQKNELIEVIKLLSQIEPFFFFPGIDLLSKMSILLEEEAYDVMCNQGTEITHILSSETENKILEKSKNTLFENNKIDTQKNKLNQSSKINFEVLYVESLSNADEKKLLDEVSKVIHNDSKFDYDLVIQKTLQDALICLLFNRDIQAVIIRQGAIRLSKNITNLIKPYIQNILKIDLAQVNDNEIGTVLASYIQQFRPELDLYYITDASLTSLDDATIKIFKRIFYRMEDFQELHLSIINGVNEKYETPFLTSLMEYSKKPITVFHALPISRGNSVFKSRWLTDFGSFYGRNIFLSETSATHGGLDSLLQPTGVLKKAQQKAANAYGAEQSFFVTNGTSTANKIVVQALVKPGDVVLIDRDCHKSHHYGLVLSGAFPVYLDSYPIEEYAMYGAVPLQVILDKLLTLKSAGRLDRVKMLLLTNCTFDGIVYNVEKVMEAVLAIKPDMIFVWDEAWFAFASFTYTFKQRTGMYVAKKLFEKYRTSKYRADYQAHIKMIKPNDIEKLPDPDKVKIRVYVTQSTHKTLSSFRQGSMIHVWDEMYSLLVADSFHEAYMTHTTTSPSYQILASLDAGRRQAELEGYKLVEKCIEMAMVLRSKIQCNPILNRYFSVLTPKDLIPKKYRVLGLEDYYTPASGWERMEDAWENDEFVLDPTKITLFVGKAGITGDTFKHNYLMDRFNIQVNKTSRNTALFMTNIGTTKSSITVLLNALLQTAEEIEERNRSFNKRESEIYKRHINAILNELPPLPDFSFFHRSFEATPGIPGGNIREAYFLAYDEDMCEYIPLNDCLNANKNGAELVSTSFVIPYPPGFPILVPGQVVSKEIIDYMIALDIKEVHGYRAELGLKIFNQKALNRKNTTSAMGAIPIQFLKPTRKKRNA